MNAFISGLSPWNIKTQNTQTHAKRKYYVGL